MLEKIEKVLGLDGHKDEKHGHKATPGRSTPSEMSEQAKSPLQVPGIPDPKDVEHKGPVAYMHETDAVKPVDAKKASDNQPASAATPLQK